MYSEENADLAAKQIQRSSLMQLVVSVSREHVSPALEIYTIFYIYKMLDAEIYRKESK